MLDKPAELLQLTSSQLAPAPAHRSESDTQKRDDLGLGNGSHRAEETRLSRR